MKTAPSLPEDYLGRLRAADPELRRVCVLVLVLGFILDGKVSWREDRRVATLREAGIVEYSVEEVRGFARAFLSGEGIEPLLNRQLAA